MSSELLVPPCSTAPDTALRLTKHAPSFFAAQSSWLANLPYPLNLFINTESQEKWQIYENIFLASLRTNELESANECIQALEKRFGPQNERVVALRGLFSEAAAKDDDELRRVTDAYEDILKADGTIFSIRKRRAALLRTLGKNGDAAAALTNLLDCSPTDAETWAELADLYAAQGAYDRAIFCLEEVLLVMPNAWNMHAKLAETLFVSAGAMQDDGTEKLSTLAESMRRACRSIELCEDYLRGYYGLKLITTRLLDIVDRSGKSSNPIYTSGSSNSDLPAPSIESVRKLNELATSKLAEIVRKSASGSPEWDGYDPAEVAAARELLDRDTKKIQR